MTKTTNADTALTWTQPTNDDGCPDDSSLVAYGDATRNGIAIEYRIYCRNGLADLPYLLVGQLLDGIMPKPIIVARTASVSGCIAVAQGSDNDVSWQWARSL